MLIWMIMFILFFDWILIVCLVGIIIDIKLLNGVIILDFLWVLIVKFLFIIFFLKIEFFIFLSKIWWLVIGVFIKIGVVIFIWGV